MLRRVLIGLGIVAAVLAVGVVALYNLGGPVSPTDEQLASYEALEAAGMAPPAPAQRFVLSIPGCVCHSDDSVQIVQHAEYRLRECSECH